jgi:hypothetical protein
MSGKKYLQHSDQNYLESHKFGFLVEVIGSHPVKFINPQQVKYKKANVDYYSDGTLNNKVDFHVI